MKTTKTLSYILLVFLATACSDSTSESNTLENHLDKKDTITQNSSDPLESAIQEEEAQVEGDKNKVWQIDDYAEKELNSSIAQTAEEAYENSSTTAYYYETLDIPGGYANVTGAFEGWYEFVLYRMKDNKDLVCRMAAGCGPACAYDFEFKVYDKGNLINENPNILPIKEIEKHEEKMHEKVLGALEYTDYPEDAQLRYIFPQKGTDMQVNLVVGADEAEIKLLVLSWDKEKFSIKKKYDEVEFAY